MRASVSRPCSSLTPLWRQKKDGQIPSCVCSFVRECVCCMPSSRLLGFLQPPYSSAALIRIITHTHTHTHRAHLWKCTVFPAPLSRWSRSIVKSCLEGSPGAIDALCRCAVCIPRVCVCACVWICAHIIHVCVCCALCLDTNPWGPTLKKWLYYKYTLHMYSSIYLPVLNVVLTTYLLLQKVDILQL